MRPELDRLLDAVERREVRSLTWGDVEASMSRDELFALAREVIKSAPDKADVEDLVEDLVEARLLHELSGGGEPRYRSRFAETVRLLARLRQIFDGEEWRGAPRLASDFRVDIRPRRYPQPSRPADDVWQGIATDGALGALERDVWRALTTGQDGKRLLLRAFQERATRRLVEPPAGAGTIIAAGTGSGKTLAFYLPTFVHLASRLTPNEHWTKVLAIYPRRELLKDQLTEALANGQRVRSALIKHGRRPLMIGALYGDVPRDASLRDASNGDAQWAMRGLDAECPMFRCPRCGGAMLWKANDRASQVERLICERDDFQTEPGTFALTRATLQSRPPDILFTTTEMLNQRMADGRMRKVFGLDQPSGRRPTLVLLDEAHTYVGSSGAQAGLVLRRWRRLSGASASFVGLSATLREAHQFFADLTGIPPHQVAEVSPHESDMMEAGAEYQVALRGDPVSAAALLSTSIQSAMLLARILDPPDRDLSDGRFGKRLFVFTDDLDVTHRLYDDLGDAEGYGRNRRPDPNRTPLAALRASTAPDATERDADGQLWRMPEQIGHVMTRPLILGRTTSRDPGVDERANVIVATAALEVGFNDQTVGAILQHKAPYSAAAFLQRRGRAGRRSEMRPLTVIVLSDYGRDRRAFQAYEHLFDPRLPAERLPVKNPYVLRMQAGFALIDWLLDTCPMAERGWWLWPTLAAPPDPQFRAHPAVAHVTAQLQALVRGDQSATNNLQTFLREALQLTEREVHALFWEPPRALILEVIPTLLRRLVRGWKKAHPSLSDDKDLWRSRHPLPDFLPPNLFSDLNLPEVDIVLPPRRYTTDQRREPMGITLALGQLGPGRVTRRFADEAGVAHWSPIDIACAQIQLPVSDYASRTEFVGHFPYVAAPGGTIAVYRPYDIGLQRVNLAVVSPSSNSRFIWDRRFSPQGEAVTIEPPRQGPWGGLVRGLSFWLHRFRASVAVVRYAPSAIAELRLKNGHEQTIDIRLVDERAQPAAVGFEIEVDGFAIDIALPSPEALTARALPEQLHASARTAFYRALVQSDRQIPDQINAFRRDWLQQIFLSAAILRAERDNVTLFEAIARLRAEQDIDAYREVMDGIFAIQDAQTDDDDSGDGDDEDTDSSGRDGRPRRHRLDRLRQRLISCFQDHILIERLAQAIETAIATEGTQFSSWLRETLNNTIAEAALAAAIEVAPRHAALDTFVVDREETLGGDRLWITETTPGGAGTVEALAERITAEPRIFFQALNAVLAPSDFELAAEALAQIIALAVNDQDVAQQLLALREAVGHEARAIARGRAFATLAQQGLPVGHTLAVSIGARLLRPGASAETDRLLHNLLARQDALEARHGLTLGLREYAYLAAVLQEDVSRTLERLELVREGAGVSNLVQALAGFLWPRASEMRERSLQSHNRWRQAYFTDPALTRTLLFEARPPMVLLSDADWRTHLRNALATAGTVQLAAENGIVEGLREALLETMGAPLDVGPLHLYPSLDRLERDAARWIATFTLREVAG